VTRFTRRTQTLPQPMQSLCGCDTDPRILDECDVIFIAVRNLVDGGRVNEEPLEAATSLLRAHDRTRLVILESTVTPGTTRRFAAALGTCDGASVFVAHAPERLSAGQDHTHLRDTPHLVAGVDALATRMAAAMLAKICDHVVPVAAPEVSEVSKLMENAFLSVNIALTGEITRLCHGLGIRAHDVCRAAATKPRGFMPFYPGAGLGGHCLPNDLVLLAQSARSQGWEPGLVNGAIAANEHAPRLVVERLRQSLAVQNAGLSGATVLIVGVGFKVGSPDTTRSPAFDVVRELRRHGARVSYVDRWNSEFIVDSLPVARILAEDVRRQRYTAGVILSGADDLRAESLLEVCSLVLDAGGSRASDAPIASIEML
jgi:nucleotide sugar dehydrogenase